MNQEIKESALEETIYNRIYEAIADRMLLPGTRLKEKRLGEIFGASRARVRSALSTLHKDGLVTLEPNRGAFVAKPSIEEARDIFFARRVVEAKLVERLSKTATPEALAQLENHLGLERNAHTAKDLTAIIRLSGGFHQLIGELAGSPYLAETLRDLVSRTSLIIAIYERRSPADCGPDEHRAIVGHIRNGDAAAAVAAVESHLSHLEERLDLRTWDDGEADLAKILGAPRKR
jgi:DNA-binding GntR family transcriptional regulator